MLSERALIFLCSALSALVVASAETGPTFAAAAWAMLDNAHVADPKREDAAARCGFVPSLGTRKVALRVPPERAEVCPALSTPSTPVPFASLGDQTAAWCADTHALDLAALQESEPSLLHAWEKAAGCRMICEMTAGPLAIQTTH